MEMLMNKCIFRNFVKKFIIAWNETPQAKEKRCMWNVEKEG